MKDFIQFVVLDGLLLVSLFFGVTFLIAMLQQSASGSNIMGKLTSAPMGLGNVYAAVGGAITPFCSCSTVPVLSSMLRARVRFGFAFTFLMASPMVNEAALIVMLRYASPLYVLSFLTLTMAFPILFGMMADKMSMARYLLPIGGGEDVAGRVEGGALGGEIPLAAKMRFAAAIGRNEVKGALPYLAAGLVVGGLIHGFVPDTLIMNVADKFSPTSLVVVMALLGIPLYFNMVTVVPIAFALAEKGVGLGPMMAFLVAGAGTSIPEMILLLKLFKKQLVLFHIVTMFVSAVVIGLLFNYVGSF